MARVAAILVGALEADDLIGDTPRRKMPRYAELSEQTPDQEAQDIARSAKLESTFHGN